MIITQTPFRMSFFGGGTDMESFFRENSLHRHAIKFSNEESKQTYAISIKVPAIQVEFRRMLPFEDDNGGKLSYTLNGTLYPDEQVVIYDIGDVKPETEKKRRGRRKKSEIEAEQKEN